MYKILIYHSKIEKVKFDKDVNIPIPGAVNFTVHREDLLEIHDTDILKFIKEYVNELTEKRSDIGTRKDRNIYRRRVLAGN